VQGENLRRFGGEHYTSTATTSWASRSPLLRGAESGSPEDWTREIDPRSEVDQERHPRDVAAEGRYQRDPDHLQHAGLLPRFKR
jgi:hypothetical protein